MRLLKILFLAFFLVFIFDASKAQTIQSWKITNLKDYISHSDSILVVNFWATFCKSCVAEIPYYQTIISQFKDQKVKLLLVSLDLKEAYPLKIRSFAKAHHYHNKVVWLNETNADYFCPEIDKKWSGVIPTTYFVNPKTGYRKLVEEQISEKDFEQNIKLAINSR